MLESDIYACTFDEDVQPANCPECDGSVITTGYETTCDDCALVIATDPIERRRPFPDTDDPDPSTRRTGGPRTPARDDRGLGSQIGRTRDGNGNQLSGATRRRLDRLRRQHGRARRGRTIDRNQVHGLTEVRRLAAALELATSIRDRVCTLFRRAQHAGLLQGRSIEAIAAATVYAACRSQGLPRTQSELEPVAGCDRSALRRSIAALNVDLGLELQPVTPAAFVPRVAAAVDAEPSVRREAVALADRAQAAGLTQGHKPFGYAAACLGVAANWEHHAHQALAAVADVTAATIRTHRDQLQDAFGNLDTA